jgi:hypothetical protein
MVYEASFGRAPKAASASSRAARTSRKRSSPVLRADARASGQRCASFKPGRGTATGLLLLTKISSNASLSRGHAIRSVSSRSFSPLRVASWRPGAVCCGLAWPGSDYVGVTPSSSSARACSGMGSLSWW